MLEKIRNLNQDYEIFTVNDSEFEQFGAVIDNIDVSEIINEAGKINMPESGSCYLPSVDEFMKTGVAKKIAYQCFGEMPAQVGYCFGYSNALNAVEWHKSSEINIAVTPLILFLGSVQDIKNNTIDSSKMKAFYVEKGQIIEVYATTLHFCPAQVLNGGFGCVVALPEGTNVPLEKDSEDKLLFRKNKWILAHNENTSLIQRGVVPGITGENFVVKGE